MKNYREIAERFVMGQCLSDYPEDFTYDQVIAALENNEDDQEGCPLVTPWEPFEYLDVGYVMENMIEAVERLLIENK